MLPTAWPHAICSWATLSHGRYGSEHINQHPPLSACRQTNRLVKCSVFVGSWTIEINSKCHKTTRITRFYNQSGEPLNDYWCLLLQQERAALSLCAHVWRESTLSCPVTPATCTASPRTLAMAMAGPCFVPGGDSASHCLPASSALWLLLWARPLAQRPTSRGKRTEQCDTGVSDPPNAQATPFQLWCLTLKLFFVKLPCHPPHTPRNVRRAWVVTEAAKVMTSSSLLIWKKAQRDLQKWQHSSIWAGNKQDFFFQFFAIWRDCLLRSEFVSKWCFF